MSASNRRFFSDEQRSAMSMVEGLIHDGALVLSTCRFNQGRLMLMEPHQVKTRSVGVDAEAASDATSIEGKALCGLALPVCDVDPLESAIRETVGLLQEHAVFLAESGLNEVQKAGLRFLGEKLNSHLNHLLTAQLGAVRKEDARSMESAAETVLGKLVALGRLSVNDYRTAIREVCG